jgi:hypothetical protein
MVVASCRNRYDGTNFISAVPTSLLIAPGLRTIQFLLISPSLSFSLLLSSLPFSLSPSFFSPIFTLISNFFSRGVLRYFTQTWRNNSFRCLLRRLPRPQDVGHLRLRYCNFFNPFYNLNCSARERGVTEKCHFSTLNVGLAGTGNRTQATCLAGSVTRRSAIHYAYLISHFLSLFSFSMLSGNPASIRTCHT